VWQYAEDVLRMSRDSGVIYDFTTDLTAIGDRSGREMSEL